MTHPTDAAIAQANELMACPFCGWNAGVFAPSKGNGVYVGCTGCQASVFACPNDVSRSREEAIAAWNRRTPVRELDAEKGGDGHRPECRSRVPIPFASCCPTPPAQAAEAVERVARAIYATEWAPGSPAWSGLDDVNRIAWRNMARAAIAAMQAGEGKK